MSSQKFNEWLDDQWEHAESWWVKRLSGRDTMAMGGRNPGPKIPRTLLLQFLPELDNPKENKPRMEFLLKVDSSEDEVTVTAESIEVKLARSESRKAGFVMDWGGVSNPMLDPENTGAAAAFAFHTRSEGSLPECHVWVCANLEEEEDVLEPMWGPIEPDREILTSRADGAREIRFLT
ncbi:MAG: hypothetical protein OXC55_02450 [Chloroflexi bacterium]|nr:hypothetical protein [Chloroflexota bacterium]